MKQGVELIERLSLCFGPTSFEGEVANAVREELSDTGLSFEADRMGNLVAHLPGVAHAPRILLSAHMDEVGFMITEIEDEGFLRFATLGGIHKSVLCGRAVMLGNETHRVPGVIAAKGIHLQTADERKKLPRIEDLYIDIGTKSREETEALVSRGDFGVFDTPFSRFGESKELIKGKALDDRVGCAALIELTRHLVKHPVAADVWVAFTVREEIGRSGATVVANRIAPDAAVVLESTAVADIAGVKENSRVASLGAGGALSLVDRSTLYDRALVDIALEAGKRHGILVQVKRFVSGGNDAAHIQRSGAGVRCMALSLPTRYLHAPMSVASLRDYESIIQLLSAMLAEWKVEVEK